MRATLRIGLRVIAAIGLFAVMMALAAMLLLTALSRGWQRERLTAELAAELGRQLGADVTIERLEGALYDEVVARGVVLSAGDRAPLTIDVLALRFDLVPFARQRRLAIESLVVEGLDVAIEQQPHGWRVSGVAEPIGAQTDTDPGGAPMLRAVEIAAFELRDARVVIRANDDATHVEMRGDATAHALQWAAGQPLRLPDEAAVQIALAPSRAAGRAIERGRLELRLGADRVELEHLDVAGAFGAIAATGAAELADSSWPLQLRRATARATFDDADLAALSGEARLASQLDGALELDFAPDAVAQPGAGLLQVRAELLAPELGALDVDTLRLRGSFHTGTRAFALDELFAAGAAGTLRAHATGAAARVDDASLQADLRLERLPAEWLGAAPLAGRVELAVDAHGTLDDPRGSAELTATELRRGGSQPARLALRAIAPGDRKLRIETLRFEAPELLIRAPEPALLRIEPGEPLAVVVESLDLAFPGGALKASGRMTPSSFAGFTIELAARDLAETVAAFGFDAELAGAAEVELRADGPFTRPSLRGSLVAAPLALSGRRIERVEIQLAPDAQRSVATLRLVDRGAERLRAVAHFAIDAVASPASLLERTDTDVRLTADALDVAWIAGALGLETDAYRGRLDLDVALRGARPAPVVAGSLRLADAYASVEALDEPLGPIRADLRLDGRALRIDSIVLPGSSGEIRATGDIEIAGTTIGAAAVQIDVRGFELPKGSPATGRLDGALRLTGTWPAVHLGGRLALDGAHVDLARRRDPVWREIRVHGLPGEEPVADRSTPDSDDRLPAALLPASAEVVLEIPPDTRVQGNGADLRVAGDVRVLKRAGEEPLYLGGIRVVDGRFQFQNRRFEIERGTVTLTGSRELDPEIDVVAVQKLRDVTLRVQVSGRASAPDATLQSDPPLDPADQMSYLAFGRPVASLGGSDAARLQSAATQVIGQLAFADLGADLDGLIPLDSLRFESDEEGVGVGGNLTPGIYVRYARDIATSDDVAYVEWQFRPQWKLRSEVSSDGNTGLDVIWSRDY